MKRKLPAQILPAPLFLADPNGYDDEDDEQNYEPARPLLKQPKERPLSSNPLVAYVEKELRQRGLKMWMDTGEDRTDVEDTLCWIERIFTTDLRQKMGKMVLLAMLDGDKTFPLIVKKAIKESDRLFNRHLEKAIHKKVRRFVAALGDFPPEDPELRRLVEEHCGQKFQDYRWRRLRTVCLLPPLPRRGRPKKKSTKR